MYENGLIRKIRLILKIYDVTTWFETFAIHIFTNISRSKGNQTMEFGQLIEYYMRNIFLEKSYTKCGGEIKPFLYMGKKSRPKFKYLENEKSF